MDFRLNGQQPVLPVNTLKGKVEAGTGKNTVLLMSLIQLENQKVE